MYVITGATGNTGRQITEQLLAAGKSVKVISRKAENLSALAEKGAIPLEGDLSDKDFLNHAFAGATAVYAMIPPNLTAENFRVYQQTVGENIAQALEEQKVDYVVVLSSFGADLAKGSGVILGLHDFEQRLQQIENLHVKNLRAGFFMENFFGMIGTIAQAGVLGGFPIQGNIKMPMVHTRDIAAVAANHLLALNFEGQSVQYVAGPEDLNMQEAASILGAVIGREDLQWVQFPYDQAKQGMIQMGISPDMAEAYVEFCKAVNDESLRGEYQRNDQNTTETTLEQFANQEFAAAWNDQLQHS